MSDEIVNTPFKLMGDDSLSGVYVGDNRANISMTVLERLVDMVEKYRALYEGAEKRIMRYRDVASTPDIFVNVLNKDRYTTHQDLIRAYDAYLSECKQNGTEPYNVTRWLFEK